MKLPLTEKFLWDVYNLIDGISDVYTAFSAPSLKDALYPEMVEIYKRVKRRRSRRKFSKFISYLKSKGYIKVGGRKTCKIVILTKRGWQKVLKIALIKEKIKQRKDKRWIMISFDIPEKLHNTRNMFREYLKGLGFKMFQQSIWISLNDVLNKVEKLAQALGIERYIRVMLVEEMEVN